MDSSSSDHSRLRTSLGIDCAGSVEMSEGDLHQCMLAFRTFEDHGRFPVTRLKEAFELSQICVSEDYIEETISSFQDAGIESMEFYDFATLVCSKKRPRRRSTHAVLASVFQLLDRDSDGFIGADELKVTMEMLLGEGQTGDVAERMIQQLDTSGRGKVSYEEFECMLSGTLGRTSA